MLIKKHEAFEETLRTQAEKVENVKKDAAALISNGNDFSAQIEERYVYYLAFFNILFSFWFK